MASVFQFKQFAVDQTGCAMKVNTDGVLLGALADAGGAKSILDIGTGTGVIALMVAQRFPHAQITGVEIDLVAAETSEKNFAHSPFANRLKLVAGDYRAHLQVNTRQQFDCIISNPPFYLQSLKSPSAQLSVAKHTNEDFFQTFVQAVATHLSPDGQCWLILPPVTATVVKGLALACGLYTKQQINIKSFAADDPHREIIALGFAKAIPTVTELVIYDSPKVYSGVYRQALKDFLIIF